MPRNTDKYCYVTATIPRDSSLYEALVADAAASGKSLADVLVLRLADYYRGEHGERRPVLTRVAAEAGATPAPVRVSEREARREEPELISYTQRDQSPMLASVQPVSLSRPEMVPTSAPPAGTEEIEEYDPARRKNAALAALANMDFDE